MNLPAMPSSLSRAPIAIRGALILTLIMTLGGLLVLRLYPLRRFDTASTLVCFSLLCLPYMLFASRHFRDWLRGLSRRNIALFPLWLLAVYLLYAVGPGRLRVPESLAIPVYLALPVLCAVLAARRGGAPNRYDLLTILAVYLPVVATALVGAWRPADSGLPTPAHPFTQLLGINLALYCFMSVRPIEGIGLSFRLTRRDVAIAVAAFALFFPFALAVGTATGFVEPEPHLPNWAHAVPVALGVTLMVALPEEIFFRGLVQNLLQRSALAARGRLPALLLASVLFGLTHLNNHPLFDWRYVFLATVAGLAYGTVYNRTGKVTAAAVTHALVDVVWRLFF
jgi:membrane protease YdiL (CAAX protease family)